MPTTWSGSTGSDARHVFHLISSTDRRGAETFASDLVTFLALRGVPGTIAALAPGQTRFPLDIPVLGNSRFSPAGMVSVRRACKRSDVVVGHGSSTLLALGLGGLGTSTPFVYRNIGDPLAWAQTPSRRARVGFLMRRARAVVTLWESSATTLGEHFGVHPDHIFVIPNAARAERFPMITEDSRADARRRLGLDAHSPVAIYVGAMSEEKSPETAIRAVSGLLDWHLVMMGDGPELPRLRASADLGRVHFVAPGSDVASVMAAADVVVLPSRTEGMPAIAIEAGLLGLPMVASNVGGIPEVVLDGRSGFLVSPGDTEGFARRVESAYSDRSKLGQNARSHCLEKFEMGVIADKWAQLLSRVS